MRWLSLLLMTTTVLTLSALRPAVSLAADPAEGHACRSDARSLCGRMQPGGGRIVACLKAHESQLSEGCKAALPMIERCAVEVRALCESASTPMDARGCLRDNAGKLSPECRAAVPTR